MTPEKLDKYFKADKSAWFKSTLLEKKFGMRIR